MREKPAPSSPGHHLVSLSVGVGDDLIGKEFRFEKFWFTARSLQHECFTITNTDHSVE